MTPKSILLKITIIATLPLTVTFAQKAEFSEENSFRKRPVSFNRPPFLLLKVTPSAFFQRDRFFQYGAELAPPFGKFSFAFDYGKGKNNGIWRNFNGHQTQEQYRAEIKMYFSDWYPFYAYDKKPMGRYYSIEYVNTKLENSAPIEPFNTLISNTEEQEIHLKIGKHFHITRFLFIDIFAGGGVGLSKTGSTVQTNFEFSPLRFTTNRTGRNIGDNIIYPAGRAGLKLCLAL